jgi:hypothetical protein
VRFQLRFAQGLLKALNSRNHLVRHTVRAAYNSSLSLNGDMDAFREMCRKWDVSVFEVPCTDVRPTTPSTVVQRPWAGGDVILVSDGSAPDGWLGWGALVADDRGVLATVADGVVCDVAYSWAAEWAGKWAAVKLATHLGIPLSYVRWSIADNLSAVIGGDGGRPSQSITVAHI